MTGLKVDLFDAGYYARATPTTEDRRP